MADPTEIQDFAAEQVLFARCTAPRLVAALIDRFPDTSAAAVMFEITCLAHELQERYHARTEATRRTGDALYKAAALLACDIHALSAADPHAVTCAEVQAFWGRGDGFFHPGSATDPGDGGRDPG